MTATGSGTGGRKPTRRSATPRTSGAPRAPRATGGGRTATGGRTTPRASQRSSAPRPGAGPGRSRAAAPGAGGTLRKAVTARVATERRASRAVLRAVVLASIAVLLAITLVPTLRSYLHQQGQIDSLRAQVGEQRNDVAQLQKEQARWNDDAYVMQQARERLKFVKVGEKSYTVIDGKPSAKAISGVATAPAASSTHPWYGQLWESVQLADTGPSAATPAAR